MGPPPVNFVVMGPDENGPFVGAGRAILPDGRRIMVADGGLLVGEFPGPGGGPPAPPGIVPYYDSAQSPPPSCDGVCGGAETMCFEPQGEVKTVNWKYVGEGRGMYSKVQTYNYVGEGGSYDQQAGSGSAARCLFTVCKVLTVLAIIALSVYYYFFVVVPSTTVSTAEENRIQQMSATTGAPSTGTPELFNCHNQALMMPAKEQYCCDRYKVFCPPAAAANVPQQLPGPPGGVPPPPPPAGAEHYDCGVGYDTWRIGWPTAKQAWCCDRVGKGCSDQKMMPYDCAAGFDNWRQGWSATKKKWCCENQNKACTG